MPAVDLFGRTESEILAAIDWQERTYAVASTYGGNEGAAIKLAIRRANLAVDRRLLAELRGEVEPEVRLLAGDALKKWRHEITTGRRYK